MSLLAAVSEWEARQAADETRRETPAKQAKQAKQPPMMFHEGVSCSTPMKHDYPQKSAISDACFTVSSPRARNSETSLPADVVEGLAKLRSGWQPGKVSAAEWLAVVADARRLAADGWASSALALGWSAHDVFGIGPTGSDQWLSLAVWLDGRDVTMMDDHRAFTSEGPVFYVERWGRPITPTPQPIFLWELWA